MPPEVFSIPTDKDSTHDQKEWADVQTSFEQIHMSEEQVLRILDEWAAKELRYSMKEVVEDGHDEEEHHGIEERSYDEWNDNGGWNERAESEKRRVVPVVPLVGEDRLAWLGKSLSTAFGYSSSALQGIGDVASLAAAIASPLQGGGVGSDILSRHGRPAEAVAPPAEPAPAHVNEGSAIASIDLVREAIFEWHPTVLFAVLLIAGPLPAAPLL